MSPRPKVGRVARSIRLCREADEYLVARSAAAGLSVNAYLERMLLDEDRPTRWADRIASDPAVRVTCSHPKKDKRVFSWGSKCGACGERLS